MKTLVICSGGLDSVTLAYKVAAEDTAFGVACPLIMGSATRKKPTMPPAPADALGVPHDLIDMTPYRGVSVWLAH